MVESLHSDCLSIPIPRLIAFANFEVDLQAGELRKAGMRLKFSGQPFQVLAILLERPGEVVTREELQKRLWPDTFVDVDHNLNTAINKIREVLGDSAENPRFVETLARRGYRFVAPIAQPKPIVHETQSTIVDAPGPSPVKTKSWAIVVSVGALIAAAVPAFLFRPAMPPPRVTASRQVTNDGLDKTGMETDGSRIYFSSYSGSHYALHQVSVAGGAAVPIQTSFENQFINDISPDRSELLVLNCENPTGVDCSVFVLPLLGQSARRLGDIRANSAAWSPDGKEIIYAKANALYRVRIDGSESSKIASLPEGVWVLQPRLSPDRSRLRFTVVTGKGGNPLWELWEVSGNGTNLHRMLSGWNKETSSLNRNWPPGECCGTWTPDGKYFLFRSSRSGIPNIWAIREAKSLFRKISKEPTQLTTSPTLNSQPLVSPDGKHVFMVAAQARGELVSYSAVLHQFVPYLSGISAISVTFSADGKSVAYCAYPEGTLWRSKMDGSERIQLTFPPMYALQPRWSPDGSRIAFEGTEPGKSFRIYVIPAEGGSAEQLVSGDHGGFDPTWSPDGNSLLFGRHPNFEAPGAGPMYVETIDLRTREISKIPGSEELWSPRWSGDGLHILAMPRAQRGLMLFDIKTQKWTALDSLAKMFVNWPEWSRRGDYIYFYGTPIGTEESVFRVRISDGKLDKIFGLSNFQQAAGWTWKGLAPDDSPLLTRDAGTMDIYALDVDFP